MGGKERSQGSRTSTHHQDQWKGGESSTFVLINNIGSERKFPSYQRVFFGPWHSWRLGVLHRVVVTRTVGDNKSYRWVNLGRVNYRSSSHGDRRNVHQTCTQAWVPSSSVDDLYLPLCEEGSGGCHLRLLFRTVLCVLLHSVTASGDPLQLMWRVSYSVLILCPFLSTSHSELSFFFFRV